MNGVIMVDILTIIILSKSMTIIIISITIKIC